MQRHSLTLISRQQSMRGPAHWREEPYSPFNNLPVPPTPLIGREAELSEAAGMLNRTDLRILTLYGPGGVGKTRLALAIASQTVPDFRDGVYYVPLADISTVSLLPSAIARTLGLYTLPDESVLGTLVDYMRDMHALLFLDNFEQIIAGAGMLAEILAGCPGLKLLVTSRSTLNIRGEQELGVQPLALPGRGAGLHAESVAANPSVALFVQRARSVKRDFRLDDTNASDVAEICVRLDGLPLAIELAAARARLLSPKAMLARLEKRLSLLTGGAEDLPVRHKTLRAAIEWSYALLTEDEQRLFRALSVFPGGCTLESAEAVWGQLRQADEVSTADPEHTPNKAQKAQKARPPDVLDIATSLTSKSLLRIVDHNGYEPRLVMLETVREYAREQLAESGEEEAARAAHALHYLRTAEEAEPNLRGAEQARWLNMLEQEVGNIRSALEWSLEGSAVHAPAGTGGAEELGLRIAGALSRFWQARGHLAEGRAWLAKLLARTGTLQNSARQQALRAAGRICSNLGEMQAAHRYYAEAVELANSVGDLQGGVYASMGIANLNLLEGNLEGALKEYEACLPILADLDSEAGIAGVLNNIALVAMHRGDLERAVRLFQESIEKSRELGDKDRTAVVLDSLGRAYSRLGDAARAEQCIYESLALNMELGDAWNTAYSLVSLAEAACAQNDHVRATMLMSAAEAAYDNVRDRLDLFDVPTYDRCRKACEAALGPKRFASVWAEGLMLTPQEAADPRRQEGAALKREGAAPARANKAGLSPRELEVLRVLAQGMSDIEVAEKLYLSRHTVNAHLRSVYGKIGVSSRAAATRYALENGLA